MHVCLPMRRQLHSVLLEQPDGCWNDPALGHDAVLLELLQPCETSRQHHSLTISFCLLHFGHAQAQAAPRA